MHTLLIDGGYVSFYRFHAALQWWQKQGQVADKCWANTQFKEIVFKKYRESLKKLIKIVKPDTAIFCFDGQDSWRKRFYPEYKGNRKASNSSIYEYMGTMRDELPNLCAELGIIWKHALHVEADDWIAYTIMNAPSDSKFTIISSDHDFYSLLNHDTCMLDINGKENVKKDSLIGDVYLQQKIIMGDKSDNIPAIFSGCGPKTALKLANSAELLEKKLSNDENAKRQMELNRKLIQFGNWPDDIETILSR